MARDAETPELPARELAELSALADGTLDPARRDAVRARISASPELSALYERERRVAELMREARATDRAPEGLRRRIEAQRPSRAATLRLRVGYRGALVGALAAVALALVLILPAGTPGAPSVSQAAALAVRGATLPAPLSASSTRLNMDVQDVYFPDWTQAFGWRAVGQRSDRINGRLASTVYYQWHGRGPWVAYTIVGAPALTSPAARVTVFTHGTEYGTLRLDGRLVVTWRRAGHTCVLSAVGVPAAELQHLAASEPSGR